MPTTLTPADYSFEYEPRTKFWWITSRLYHDDGAAMRYIVIKLWLRYYLFFEGGLLGKRGGYKTRKAIVRYIAKNENEHREHLRKENSPCLKS